MLSREKLAGILLVISFILSSCTSDKDLVKDAIKGIWNIEVMTYKGKDITGCTVMNGISFEDEYCNLPMVYRDCLVKNGFNIQHCEVDGGQWDVEISNTSPMSMDIFGFNHVFIGKHKLRFFQSNGPDYFTMEIKSDNLYIRAHKTLLWLQPVKPQVLDYLVTLSNR